MTASQVEPTTTSARVERDDRHLVRVGTLLFGLEAGVDVQAYCGAWVKPWVPYREPGLVVEVGGLFPAYLRRDCPACVAVHAEICDRRWSEQRPIVE